MKTQKKVCTRCGEKKPTSDFYKHPQTRDKLAPHCKKCDNARSRPVTGTRINRMRARHRALADLIEMYPEEFEALLAIRLAEAKEEAEALAAEPAAKEHYQPDEPVRLKPGKRMPGETIGDRIDVARCPHCVKHHDRGHVCESCGSAPGKKLETRKQSIAAKPIPSGMRPRVGVDMAALEEFNRGTKRAGMAR